MKNFNKNERIVTDCAAWYQGLSGQYALLQLDAIISEYLSEIFGYYCLNLGILSERKEFLNNSRISTGFSIGCGVNKNDVIAMPEQLPIAADEVDLVIASHVLECSNNPHQVLREIDRVLVPEGHCILIGFNPYALMGAKRLLKPLRIKNKEVSGTLGTPETSSDLSPHYQKYKTRTVSHVRDWFSLLGFETLEVNYLGFRPSIKNEKLFASNAWMEKWGAKLWPVLGSLYIIHAKKHMIAMRPHKKVWETPFVLTGGKVALNRTAQRVRRTNFQN
ncbi:MAG: class I SAM-dependent methyltransferase [Cocleimonas sp.]|nr:class I SAM-dependent methyltransferase [Cocleimonas sp.]